ncbi:hypothetical protein L1987_36925 [Smallanthus sonchifolius]|uniref:Uncharacterized protein n=1 Tax=Smallanthus sonchifolius TaxID=185202 RepID=A0ACB9HG73_9ASTR|nr:hypothetical protein L1987_36925 [Smallanthus sonchifolius]
MDIVGGLLVVYFGVGSLGGAVMTSNRRVLIISTSLHPQNRKRGYDTQLYMPLWLAQNDLASRYPKLKSLQKLMESRRDYSHGFA